ncbi:PhoH family protein [Pediococcus pentosaceus]|uniref:PhoH-like protein n=1 Tax=Pediococcus pentosaceus (strain ATCC 25745 / CCUG 21536 / LMG 10740 / 183-1w) TaxID=278197 RepID=Q03F60_PEDPA|nr:MULTISPECIES: PhoH family protein [Pediococcus]ABJ68162.1 Phosphate starvation-inducible protein PhoH, predicted ATPase [Pediococcus pentosaceus ATCC 25745]ASC08326.1 PhoH-like protein [Pediococcus pentosaceus]AVL01608.1 PhoH family protein [Pediococcus pentosaceus]KAF5441107.1 PhoH family protein [Pediococcus sp. EKM202D]KAF5441330.1 PhoH family protein [Pediococcus sp. EKM201D]
MTEEVFEKNLILSDPNLEVSLLGNQERFIPVLEEGMNVKVLPFGERITIKGSKNAVEQTYEVLKTLLKILRSGVQLNSADFVSAMKMVEKGTLDYLPDLYSTILIKDAKGKPVRIKNFGQRQYVQSVNDNDVTFGIGPAGTGKTYLAVVMAIAALKKGEVERIILTRPAVEAGESLGFLPGDLKEKVDPYLRPVYDALYQIIGAEHTTRLLDRGVIEIAPLAYMRGRTLDNAFVILDEAQNTTNQQMKMFLTRLGFGSKMIVNGDVTQIDLPRGTRSGLKEAQLVLQGINKIEFVNFTANDVIRHPVVAKIVQAYDDKEAKG